jgi:hypothetical protein
VEAEGTAAGAAAKCAAPDAIGRLCFAIHGPQRPGARIPDGGGRMSEFQYGVTAGCRLPMGVTIADLLAVGVVKVEPEPAA